MGYIFEELVRRFSESYNEQAGAHFTARDIIYLMTDLLEPRTIITKKQFKRFSKLYMTKVKYIRENIKGGIVNLVKHSSQRLNSKTENAQIAVEKSNGRKKKLISLNFLNTQINY